MAKTPASVDKLIAELTKRFGADLARVFIEAVQSISDNVVLADLVAAIEKKDVQQAMRILSIQSASFRAVETKIAQAYEAGGSTVAKTIPKKLVDRFGVRSAFVFDVRSTASEEWLRTHSSQLITRLTDDARDATMQSLERSMIQGVNPRTAALDIVGRIDATTGRRSGGVVGLNGPQERAANRARQELRSVDPAELQNYLTRKMRDHRFDSYVNEAIKTGKRIDPVIAEKMYGRYSDKLLKLRGDTIGRKEMIETLNHAQWETYRQAQQTGKIKPGAALKEWDSAGDGRVRDSHAELDGQRVKLDEAFISPATGRAMMFPGDTSHGASGEDTINCRCRVKYVIDYFAALAG